MKKKSFFEVYLKNKKKSITDMIEFEVDKHGWSVDGFVHLEVSNFIILPYPNFATRDTTGSHR